VSKSGLADSPFFSPPPQASVEPVSPTSPKPPVKKETNIVPVRKEKSVATMQPRHQDSMVSSNHDTTVSRVQDTTIETVRKAVKELGKEAATHRFTPEEKKALLDIVYSYKSQGIKTSENEVARIAINFILEDYEQNGSNSILDKVLRALNE